MGKTRKYFYLPDASTGRLRRVRGATYAAFACSVDVLFFDDDPDNIATVSKDPRVRGELVDVVPTTEFDRAWASDADVQRYVREISGQPPLSSQALTRRHMNRACRWITTHPGGAVVFDYDMVLNRAEGIVFGTDASPATIAKYNVGSERRLRRIRDMIDFIVQHSGKVYIVTNNAGFSSTFVDICHAIHPAFDASNVVSSLETERNKLVCMYRKGILCPPTTSSS